MKSPSGTLNFQEAAKTLRSQGIATGPCLLFRQLRRRKILMADNLPYQQYINCGWFRVKRGTYEHPRDGRLQYTRTFITETGIRAIERLLQDNKKPWKINAVINLPNCILGF
ncbi:MAG: hypothetical protein A2017_18200 [Lentisphaerae bacterium GWF2_44_16]|nr:MAG: hypothetical protein A2017_18200 [Lentisphaerae bacterium GWF2_44_16]